MPTVAQDGTDLHLVPVLGGSAQPRPQRAMIIDLAVYSKYLLFIGTIERLSSTLRINY